MLGIDNCRNGKEISGEGPSKWQARNLGAVRRRLVKAIQDYEASPDRLTTARIQSLRALTYALGTLGSIVRDQSLDSIDERLKKLEGRKE